MACFSYLLPLLLAAGPSAGVVYSVGDGPMSGRPNQPGYYEMGPVPGGANIKQVAAGPYHSVALRKDGTVLTWGNNDRDQLGTGSEKNVSAYSPVTVAGLPPCRAVAAGTNFSLALAQDGTVYGWGDNTAGQLGPNVKATRWPTPVAIPGLTNITALAAGLSSGFALTADRHVFSWGDNHNGGLGDGTLISRATPKQIPNLQYVAQIATGGTRAYAVLTNHKVLGWGDNIYGQLGVGLPDALVKTPSPVPGLSDIDQVAVGTGHALAVNGAGQVYAWGRNDDGQLGIPTLTKTWKGVSAPRLVPGLAGIDQVDAGDVVSVFHDRDGRLYAAGYTFGLFPKALTATPTLIPYLEKVTQFSAGSFQILAVSTTDVPVWGTYADSEIVAGHQATTLLLNVEGGAKSDITFNLSTAKNLLAVPATVTIKKGQTQCRVPVSAPKALRTYRSDTVIAQTSTAATRAASLLNLVPEIITIQFLPNEVQAGDTLAAVVSLNFPAPKGDLEVSLSCDTPDRANYPTDFTIYEGQTSAAFPILTTPATTNASLTFQVQAGWRTGVGYLTSDGNLVASCRFDRREMVGGDSVNLLIQLATAAPKGGTTVNLLQGGKDFIMPATVVVPEGKWFASVKVGTHAVTTASDVPVTLYASPSYPRVAYVKLKPKS